MGSEQNNSTNFPPTEQKLCANGCGFFGTAANMNLCSKCYRDFRIEEEQAASAKIAVDKSLNPNRPKISVDPYVKSSIIVESANESSSGSIRGEGSATEPPRAVATRCFSCNKKVGLTGFKCKCGSTFCGVHRYPEKHECDFDFKGTERDAIAKTNPVIKADKIERC